MSVIDEEKEPSAGAKASAYLPSFTVLGKVTKFCVELIFHKFDLKPVRKNAFFLDFHPC